MLEYSILPQQKVVISSLGRAINLPLSLAITSLFVILSGMMSEKAHI